nr:uncharacterized mitochondrial protein AtMg00810-like [Tanacetum cinerariifolium]
SEYVAVSGCCAQALWIRTQLTYYGFFNDKVPIYCDSKSAIAISCNLVQHTHIKNIDMSFNTPFDHFDSALFKPYVAPEAISEASSSNTVEPNEIASTPLPYV